MIDKANFPKISEIAGGIRLSSTMPRCGFAIGTSVMTLSGMVPVETLTPGQRVMTRRGAAILTGVEVSVVALAEMVRVSKDIIGADWPDTAVYLSPDQPILVQDWRARVMAGKSAAMFAVRDLVDDAYFTFEMVENAKLISLSFQEREVVYAGGLQLGCEASVLPVVTPKGLQLPVGNCTPLHHIAYILTKHP